MSTEAALRAAARIRNLPTSYADTMLSLFGASEEDQKACETIILHRIAAIIDEELSPAVSIIKPNETAN